MKFHKSSILVLLFALTMFSSERIFSQTGTREVKEAGKTELQKLIKERNNKPLFINVWATWCAPCREEFPDLVRLADKYKGKVDFIGITVDEPDELESKIKPFLARNKVNFNILINSFPDAEEFINYLDNEWNGAIPATFIYDRDGKKVSSIIGKQDYKFFETEILKVLKE